MRDQLLDNISHRRYNPLAICPWWAIWPFEIMIISLAHISGLLSDFNEKKRLGLAEVVSHVCRKYDNFLRSTSFIVWVFIKLHLIV
jgi:galactose-1-phosphate uridylyltransferase